MKTLLLSAAAAFALAAPAFSQSASEFTFMHFNMDQDSGSDARMFNGNLTKEQNDAIKMVCEAFGMGSGSGNDFSCGSGTIAIAMGGGHSPRAAAIFSQLMAEDMDGGN